MQPANWGVLFDWDGVIIDSSRQHERAWERMAAERGCVLGPGLFKRSFGMRNDRVITELFGWTQDFDEADRFSRIKEGYYREIIQAEGIEPLPGVRDWIESARREGILMAVASSTSKANIDCALEVLGFDSLFDAVVTAEDVRHGKPDPEVFLKAARRLGLSPDRCVVFEDAHVGIEAARAAHARVVALTTTHPAESLTDADRVIEAVTDLPVAELAGWFGGAA